MMIEGEVAIPLSEQALRNLSTYPVTCVLAPGINRLVVPNRRFIFIGNGGSSAFSSSIKFSFTIGTLTFDAGTSFAGDTDKVTLGNYIQLSNLDLSTVTNQPLKVQSSADVTGGTGSSATWLVSYRVIDLNGLI